MLVNAFQLICVRSPLKPSSFLLVYFGFWLCWGSVQGLVLVRTASIDELLSPDLQFCFVLNHLYLRVYTLTHFEIRFNKTDYKEIKVFLKIEMFLYENCVS